MSVRKWARDRVRYVDSEDVTRAGLARELRWAAKQLQRGHSPKYVIDALALRKSRRRWNR